MVLGMDMLIISPKLNIDCPQSIAKKADSNSRASTTPNDKDDASVCWHSIGYTVRRWRSTQGIGIVKEKDD
jgi:hypothetical protein